MPEEDIQVQIDENSTCKSKKRFMKGCGCGCLVVILILAGLAYWGYHYFASYLNEFEDQGYKLVEGQALSVGPEVVVDGSVVYFCQVVNIEGTINGDVAAVCQSFIVNGTINGKVDLLCQSATITKTGVVTGGINAKSVQLMSVKGDVQGKITGAIQQLDQKTAQQIDQIPAQPSDQ